MMMVLNTQVMVLIAYDCLLYDCVVAVCTVSWYFQAQCLTGSVVHTRLSLYKRQNHATQKHMLHHDGSHNSNDNDTNMRMIRTEYRH